MSKIYIRLGLAGIAAVLMIGLVATYQNSQKNNSGEVLGANTNDLSELTRANTYTNLSPTDFTQKIATNPDVVIVDVRTQTERSSVGYIKNSENIDYYDPAFEDKISSLDKTKTYVVYCRSGQRSVRAAQLMVDKGFEKVYNLAGGMNAWETAGLEIIK